MDPGKIMFGNVSTPFKMLLQRARDFEVGAETPSQTWAFRGQPAEYGTLTTSLARAVPSRDSWPPILDIERCLLKEFRKRYTEKHSPTSGLPEPKQIASGFDLRCMSVMQHYEIPTRLLDWTSNYWIALFFACSGGSDARGELWGYRRNLFAGRNVEGVDIESLADKTSCPKQEPQLLNRLPKIELYEIDFSLTPRMRRQEAHHTFCTHPWVDHADALQELASSSPGLGLFRLLIDPDSKPRILRYLSEHHGITEDHVFPDIAGLSKYLCEQVRYWNRELT
jgi:hypothetical protein